LSLAVTFPGDVHDVPAPAPAFFTTVEPDCVIVTLRPTATLVVAPVIELSFRQRSPREATFEGMTTPAGIVRQLVVESW
jgi:hypothetical protein